MARHQPSEQRTPSRTSSDGWLSEQEQASWLNVAGLMVRLPAALDAQLQRDAGLSHFDYMVLAMLSGQPGRTLRMSELATMASGSLSRLSHVVARLERAGFVRREPSIEDGRSTNAVLTEAGYAKVVATAPGHVAAVRQLVIDALSPAQLRKLGNAAGRVVQAIEDSDLRPAP